MIGISADFINRAERSSYRSEEENRKCFDRLHFLFFKDYLPTWFAEEKLKWFQHKPYFT